MGKEKTLQEKIAKAKAVKVAEINRNAEWQNIAKSLFIEFNVLEYYTHEELDTCRAACRAAILEIGEWLENRLKQVS